MKKILNLALIAIITTSVSYFGCNDGKGVGSFTATINGEAWTAIAPTGVKTGNRLTITGLSLNKQIVININGLTVGTYDMSVINGQINPLVYTPDVNAQGAQQTYAGVSGTIIVTDVSDSRVTGTFNVTASNAAMSIININGQFTDVKFF
ncbi:MAG: DUF6252 family protein [Flavobacteriales bacterium]|nr:DUF6252 family protein [Flavobacteriales bacterium]